MEKTVLSLKSYANAAFTIDKLPVELSHAEEKIESIRYW
jgi:hypothetical protein